MTASCVCWVHFFGEGGVDAPDYFSIISLDLTFLSGSPGLSNMGKSERFHFKHKIRMLLQRCVRRFGAERLIAKVPEEDQKLIRNLRKVRHCEGRGRAGALLLPLLCPHTRWTSFLSVSPSPLSSLSLLLSLSHLSLPPPPPPPLHPSRIQELDRKRRANDKKKAAKRAGKRDKSDAMPEATESRHRSYEQLLDDKESEDEDEDATPAMTTAAYLRDDADDDTPMDLMDNRMAGNIAANKPAKRRTAERCVGPGAELAGQRERRWRESEGTRETKTKGRQGCSTRRTAAASFLPPCPWRQDIRGRRGHQDGQERPRACGGCRGHQAGPQGPQRSALRHQGDYQRGRVSAGAQGRRPQHGHGHPPRPRAVRCWWRLAKGCLERFLWTTVCVLTRRCRFHVCRKKAKKMTEFLEAMEGSEDEDGEESGPPRKRAPGRTAGAFFFSFLFLLARPVTRVGPFVSCLPFRFFVLYRWRKEDRVQVAAGLGLRVQACCGRHEEEGRARALCLRAARH